MRVKVGRVRDPHYFEINNLALLDVFFCCFVFWISPYVLHQNFELLLIPKTALEVFQGIKNGLISSMRITNTLEICLELMFLETLLSPSKLGRGPG